MRVAAHCREPAANAVLLNDIEDRPEVALANLLRPPRDEELLGLDRRCNVPLAVREAIVMRRLGEGVALVFVKFERLRGLHRVENLRPLVEDCVSALNHLPELALAIAAVANLDLADRALGSDKAIQAKPLDEAGHEIP